MRSEYDRMKDAGLKYIADQVKHLAGRKYGYYQGAVTAHGKRSPDLDYIAKRACYLLGVDSLCVVLKNHRTGRNLIVWVDEEGNLYSGKIRRGYHKVCSQDTFQHDTVEDAIASIVRRITR